jgi:hypothetical protein
MVNIIERIYEMKMNVAEEILHKNGDDKFPGCLALGSALLSDPSAG